MTEENLPVVESETIASSDEQAVVIGQESEKNEPEKKGKVGPTLFRSASLIAAVTILSKILGLIRDQTIGHTYGASVQSDAYNYAFQVVSFFIVLLGGLGGPFHTATVSVLSKLLTGHEKPTSEAERIVNTFITFTAFIGVGLSLFAFFGATEIINVIAANASDELKAIAITDLRWMSPLVLIGSLVGIFYGVANVYHKFFWPSFSPSMLNITLIIWLWSGQADAAGLALAVSTLAGGILQLLVQVPDFFRAGFRWFPAFDFKNSHFKTMGNLLIPATVGTTIGQLNVYVAMFFVSQLPPGGWTATQMGNRLIQLPIGVLTIALLVPLFPMFARWVQENAIDTLASKFRDGILTLWLMSFPIMVLIFLVARPGVAFLFQHGEFDARDTQLVSTVLVVLSLSIVPYMLRDGITRIFYAYHDSRTPLISGVISIGLNFVLNAVLVGPYGIAGIAFSQVLVTIANAIMLVALSRKHIQTLGLRLMLPQAGIMILSSGIAWGAGSLVLSRLTPWIESQIAAQTLIPTLGWFLLVLTGLLTVFPVYLAAILLLRLEIASRFLARFRKV